MQSSRLLAHALTKKLHRIEVGKLDVYGAWFSQFGHMRIHTITSMVMHFHAYDPLIECFALRSVISLLRTL